MLSCSVRYIYPIKKDFEPDTQAQNTGCTLSLVIGTLANVVVQLQTTTIIIVLIIHSLVQCRVVFLRLERLCRVEPNRTAHLPGMMWI